MRRARGFPLETENPGRPSGRISVIIPTYNSGPWVAEAVASVLGQTRPAFEVLVVDDGSTDDTPERMAAFGPPVRYVRKENGGVSSARNRGMAEATGDAIAFLDADDVWHPRKLELQSRTLDAHPELGLVGTHLYDWPGTHPDPEGLGHQTPETIHLDDLIVRNSLVTSTVLARTPILRAAGDFDLNLRGPEDHDFWIRVAKIARVANLPAALTGYRSATPGSLSKNAERMEAGMFAILAKLEAGGAFAGRPLLRRKAWGYFRYSCGFMRYRAGAMRPAVGHLVRSLAGYPLPYPSADVRTPFGRVRLLAAAAVKSLRGGPARPASDGGP